MMNRSNLDVDDDAVHSELTLLSEPFLPGQPPGCQTCYQRKRAHLNSRVAVPWLLSLILLVALVWFSINAAAVTRDEDGFWKQSDFPNLKYNESHKLYRPIPEGTDYVGPVSAELDTAWDELIGAVEIVLTHDEAKYFSGDLYVDPTTGQHRGFVTAHHDLHCLNMIRQYVYKDRYPGLDQDYTTMPHVAHCIDALRESLMCYGDMTIIPLRWSENRGNKMPDYEVKHTCRDYGALRDWSLKRAV